MTYADLPIGTIVYVNMTSCGETLRVGYVDSHLKAEGWVNVHFSGCKTGYAVPYEYMIPAAVLEADLP